MDAASRRFLAGGVGCLAALAAWALAAGGTFWLIVFAIPGQRLRLPVVVWGVLHAIYALPGYWPLVAAAAVAAVVGLLAALAAHGAVARFAGPATAVTVVTPPPPILGPTGTLPSVAPPRPGVAPAWRHPGVLAAGGGLLLGLGACALVGGVALLGLRASARAGQEWEGVAVCRLVDPQSRDVIRRGAMVSYDSASGTSEVIACFRDAWIERGLIFVRAEPSYAGGRWMEVSQWRTREGDYFAYTVYTDGGRTRILITKDDGITQAAPPLPITATAIPNRITVGRGSIPAAGTALSLTSSNRPDRIANVFDANRLMFITYTASNVRRGETLELRLFRDGIRETLSGGERTFDQDATFYGSFSYTPTVAGVYRGEFYYNGAVAPSQTIVFWVR